MDNIKPAALVTMAGGVLLLISTFLDWFGVLGFGFNLFEGDLFGLSGIFMLIMAIICIVVPLLGALAPDVNLPSNVAGMSMNQVLHAFGFAALLLSFSLLFRDNSAEIGTILGLLGSIGVVAGTHMEQNAS